MSIGRKLIIHKALCVCFDQKSAWLAVFYMCIPTGYAFGYVYGGVVSYFLLFVLSMS